MANILIGTDLVYIPKVERLLGNAEATRKLFHPSELKGSVEHAAGVFAAKEALFKALGKQPDWLAVEVITNKSGRPSLQLNADVEKKGYKATLSISHENEYALAFVVLNKENG